MAKVIGGGRLMAEKREWAVGLFYNHYTGKWDNMVYRPKGLGASTARRVARLLNADEAKP